MPVIRSSRRSVGSTGRPVSSRVRHTVAGDLWRQRCWLRPATGDVETVQTILGHACLDHSKPYLTVDIEVIRRAFELALA